VINVTNPQITTQAIANHFFCFFAKATIPKTKPIKAKGIPNKAHITDNANSNHTKLNTKLVIESADFCSVFFLLIPKNYK
jgi:hypothetical protein